MQPIKARPPGLDAPWTEHIIKWISSINTWFYRRSGGKRGAVFLGAPVMLLTTIGRKSGEPRTKPLLYMRDGADVICVASKGGTKSHPLWYRNLLATPACTVQIGDTTADYVARTASAAEKERLWPKLVELYADFASYQAWTERQIPVVILERA